MIHEKLDTYIIDEQYNLIVHFWKPYALARQSRSPYLIITLSLSTVGCLIASSPVAYYSIKTKAWVYIDPSPRAQCQPSLLTQYLLLSREQ